VRQVFEGGIKPERAKSPRPHHAVGVYIINDGVVAYHQFRRNCISSARRAGYHQAAGGYTLARDEIQGRRAALDDIHDCVVMIYQACGLDKKLKRPRKVALIFAKKRANGA